VNVLRILRFAVVLSLVLVGARVWAAPEEPIVVLMNHTTGPAAWRAAEWRLTAELRGLQMRVVSGASVTESDPDLPERVMRAKALVGIQVLRDGDRGIIRFWFAPQRGQRSGYQHIEVNLRNADVVSRAVLPVVESIFDRTRTSMEQADAPLQGELASTDPCLGVTSELCRAPLSLRLGVAAFLAHADPGATGAIELGARVKLWPGARLELDGAKLFLGPEFEGGSRHRQWTARGHLMFETWAKDGRGAAIGPGLGVVSVHNSNHSLLAATAGARAEFFVPISRKVNVFFGATAARMVRQPGRSEVGPWFADAVVGFDWNLGL
jgi:hypothetical protein